MTGALAAKTLTVWLIILSLAVLNGLLREAVLIPMVGPVAGMVVSGVLLSMLIVVTAYIAIPWFATRQVKHLAIVGGVWLCLTLVFEFSLGLLQHKPLSVVLEAYSFRDGNLWPLVLMVTACAPQAAALLRRRR